MSHFVYANPARCIGCDTCLAACAGAHMAAGALPRPRLYILRSSTASIPVTCRHCDNAPCVLACPVKALTMKGGCVLLDESLCNGCQLCVPACPFGAIVLTDLDPAWEQFNSSGLNQDGFNPTSANHSRIAMKCDCNIAKKGAECVNACPTKALSVVNTKSIRIAANAKRKAAAAAVPSTTGFLVEQKTRS